MKYLKSSVCWTDGETLMKFLLTMQNGSRGAKRVKPGTKGAHCNRTANDG